MSRITIAIISIIASVGLYICLRVLKQYNVNKTTQNAIMFIPCSIIFGCWAYLTGDNLRIGRNMFFLMIPISIIFSRLPNKLSLHSIHSAPNIGYSLMISKSYVVLATILAVPLLGSTLELVDIVSIAMIVGFMGLIMIEPKKSKINVKVSSTRIRTALYACIGRAGLALSSSRLIKNGISALVVNFWIFLVVSITILIESNFKTIIVKIENKIGIYVLGVVFFMILFNRSLQTGYALAPNPGYVSAANSSSIALLTLVSAAIFKDALSLKKIIGIIGVATGISILLIF